MTARLLPPASAFLAEIWRGCVDAIGRGQWEASASLGMKFIAQMRYVILPQALKIAVPPTVIPDDDEVPVEPGESILKPWDAVGAVVVLDPLPDWVARYDTNPGGIVAGRVRGVVLGADSDARHGVLLCRWALRQQSRFGHRAAPAEDPGLCPGRVPCSRSRG